MIVYYFFRILMQDSFYQQASQHSTQHEGLISISTARLQAARIWFGTGQTDEMNFDERLFGITKQWLTRSAPSDGLSVQYLFSVANARFGLVNTAKCIFDIYGTNSNDVAVNKQVCGS